ncbi:MAG: hypothetical protein ACK5NN_12480, partial [Sphingomonadaceae bacterium]
MVINGNMEIPGVEAMKAHYVDHIWPHFIEKLTPQLFVSDEQALAVQMWTNFRALHTAETLFGPVVKDDQFDYRGVIMYAIRGGRFEQIIVSYNSFSKTAADGTVTQLGIVH